MNTGGGRVFPPPPPTFLTGGGRPGSYAYDLVEGRTDHEISHVLNWRLKCSRLYPSSKSWTKSYFFKPMDSFWYVVKINLTFSLNHNFKVLCESGAAPGCLLGGGGPKCLATGARAQKTLCQAWKSSWWGGGGELLHIFFPTSTLKYI